MATPRHDFTARQGNTAQLAALYSTLGETGAKVPRDFTGAVLVAYFKWPAGTLTKAAGAGVTVEGNLVTVTLTPAETAALPAGNAVLYEIEMALGGVQTTLLAGTLRIERGINA